MNNDLQFLECLEIDEFKINFIKNDTTITEYAKKNKLWEDWLEKYIKYSYQQNTNMIDIGSNIGTTSLIMSRYISDNYYIHSFEPVYNKILEMNITQNNLTNKVKIYPIGLSNKTEIVKGGIIDFSIKTNYGYTRIDDLEKTDENFEYKIYTKTLDSCNIENVSFIKLDVEGCERKVLDGAKNTIIKYTPTILIEIWSTSTNSIKKYSEDQRGIKSQLDIFEYLFNFGYICIPVSPQTDDFLFIHYTKKELLKKILDIL
jgi:FkbM family methyltransferase